MKDRYDVRRVHPGALNKVCQLGSNPEGCGLKSKIKRKEGEKVFEALYRKEINQFKWDWLYRAFLVVAGLVNISLPFWEKNGGDIGALMHLFIGMFAMITALAIKDDLPPARKWAPIILVAAGMINISFPAWEQKAIFFAALMHILIGAKIIEAQFIIRDKMKAAGG